MKQKKGPKISWFSKRHPRDMPFWIIWTNLFKNQKFFGEKS